MPLLLGPAAAGWSPWLPLMGVAWIAAYPMSWAVTGMLTARRHERFHRAAVVWSPICLAAGAPLLLVHTWLVWVIAGYGALFAINLQQARNRHERSMTNNLVLIVECSLLVPVVAGVVGDEQGISVPVDAMTAAPVVAATAAVLLALAGSTLHVKSLIRERNNPAYARASVAFAFAAPLVMTGVCLGLDLSAWLAVPFTLLYARAVWCRNPRWRPARIGMIELAGLVAVAVGGFVAL